MKGISEVQDWSLLIAKKFGFVPRSVVWDLLTPKGRTARYSYWRELQKSPLFAPYVIGGSHAEYLILNSKGREVVGIDAVTEVANPYLAHDEIVMRFCVMLMQLTVSAGIYSEAELKKDRLLAMKLLGDATVSKIPDLLFDLSNQTDSARIALEIERTRKSKNRYQAMRRAYVRSPYVDKLLFGVNNDSIAEVIQEVFYEGGLEFFDMEVGFFSIDEFLEIGFSARVRFKNRDASLEECLHSSNAKESGNADFRRHGVRGKLHEVSEESWS